MKVLFVISVLVMLAAGIFEGYYTYGEPNTFTMPFRVIPWWVWTMGGVGFVGAAIATWNEEHS